MHERQLMHSKSKQDLIPIHEVVERSGHSLQDGSSI